MVIREITRPELLQQVRRSLDLPLVVENYIDDPLIASLVRRAASFLCPCSRATVATAVVDSLEFLPENRDELRDQVEAAVEGLIAFGDILELNQVVIDDPDAKGTWIFSAPLGFVRRRSGTVLLLGIAKDEANPLPSELRTRIVHNRYARIIPTDGQDVAPILLGLGLIAHSEDTWMKGPPTITARSLINKIEERLIAQPPSGEIPELIFMRPDSDISYYRGRWATPRNETGNFIARRSQEFGRSALWGVAQLSNGAATKFLDLPTKARWRGCDEAWYIQMAIDANRGAPQTYRVRAASEGCFFDFFSPIPSWAERRLAVIGDPAPREQCLFSYRIPSADIQAEEEFLQKRLWLARQSHKT